MPSGVAQSGVWFEEQVTHALARVDALAREVAHLQRALTAREHEANELRQSLALIEGRTLRQEAGQDAVRDLLQAVAALDARFTEASLRSRDQTAALAHAQERDVDAEGALARAILGLSDRVADIERGTAAVAERQANLRSNVAAGEARELQLDGRIEALAAQLDALLQLTRRDGAPASEANDAARHLEQRVRSVEAQSADLLREQRRLDDELSGLRRIAEREESLSDLQEQHRVLRQRLEAGLATLEARTVAAEETQFDDTEESRRVRVRLDGLERSVGELRAQLDGQRGVLLEHFRRATATAEDAGRRQMDEIDRQARAARELLVRLAENADETLREQPL
jgi:chromosome segregation ATPase